MLTMMGRDRLVNCDGLHISLVLECILGIMELDEKDYAHCDY